MLLAREFVQYISKQLVQRLSPVLIELNRPISWRKESADVINEELAAEDRLNDEVRDIL